MFLRKFFDRVSAQPTAQTFTIEQLHLLWANALSRTCCFIALALNCGMGQQGISDLRMDELDWDGGCIENEEVLTLYPPTRSLALAWSAHTTVDAVQ